MQLLFIKRILFLTLFICGISLAREVATDLRTVTWTVTPQVPSLVQQRADQNVWQQVLVLTEPRVDPGMDQLQSQLATDDPRWEQALQSFKTTLVNEVQLQDQLFVTDYFAGTTVMGLRFRGADQLQLLLSDPRVYAIEPVEDGTDADTLAQLVNALVIPRTGPKNLQQTEKFQATAATDATKPLSGPVAPVQINASSLVLSLGKSGTGQGQIADAPNDIVCDAACTSMHTNFPQGRAIRLQATPAAGHSFDGWQSDACPDPQASTCSFTLNASSRVTAQFSGLGEGATISALTSLQTPLTVEPLAPVQVQAIGQESYALQANGQLWRWGQSSSAPVTKLFMSDVASFAAGQSHGLAIKKDGTLWAWGNNSVGQLGDGTTTSRNTPQQVGSGYTQIAAGQDHSLALKADGTLWAWGSNQSGQLGVGTVTNALTPVFVGRNFKKVLAGNHTSMAIKIDNSLWSWGSNIKGILGVGSSLEKSLVPLLVGQGYQEVALTNGGYSRLHVLAVKTDHSLWMWGSDTKDTNVSSPRFFKQPVQIGEGYVKVAAGNGFSMAIKTDASLWAWGVNDSGQLGNGALVFSSQAVLVGQNFTDVSASNNHVIAVQDGHVVTWGGGSLLGTGRPGPQTLPARLVLGHGLVVSSFYNLDQVTVNVESTDGGVQCTPDGLDCAESYEAGASVTLVARDSFNKSFSHWLGDCTGSGPCTVTMDQPRQVSAVYLTSVAVRFTDVEAGDSVSFAIDTNGQLWGWGNPSLLLKGLNTYDFSPQIIASGFSVVSTSVNSYGNAHVLALKPDGGLWAWGNNINGQLGDGTNTNRLDMPVKVGDGFSSMSAGNGYSLALKPDGSLWAWGRYGTGSSMLVDSAVPVLVGQGFQAISASWAPVAINSAGNAYRWMSDTFVSLSLTSVTQASGVLVLKADGTVWDLQQSWAGPASVAGGPYFAIEGGNAKFAMDADNKAWAWGQNDHGQVGDGSQNPVSAPKLIEGRFAKISSGSSHTLGLTPGGDILSWGNHSYGQLGFSSSAPSLTPARALIYRTTHPLQIDLQGTGDGNVRSNPDGASCAGQCVFQLFDGATVVLTATPSPGSVFAGWSGACTGTAPCQITLGAAAQVIATFNTLTYPLTVSNTGVTSAPASIDCGALCSSDFGYDDMVVLQATPSSGHTFEGWGGDCSGLAECVVLTYQARQITAQFSRPNDVQLSLVAQGGGGISIQTGDTDTPCASTCQTRVTYGSAVTFTATPSAGHVFKGWTGACSGQTPTCTLTLEQDTQVTASFISEKQLRIQRLIPILMMLLDD